MLISTIQGQNGQPSAYVDPRYSQGAQHFDPSQVAQQAQDPNNPAHPQNPNVCSFLVMLAVIAICADRFEASPMGKRSGCQIRSSCCFRSVSFLLAVYLEPNTDQS